MSGPLTYLEPDHLKVYREMAPHVVALLDAGRRDARRAGWLLPDFMRVWLRELDVMAAGHKAAVPQASEPRWLPTSEVAQLLHVGVRQVSNLGFPSVLRGGKRLWSEAAVLEEAEWRAQRKSSEVPGFRTDGGLRESTA